MPWKYHVTDKQVNANLTEGQMALTAKVTSSVRPGTYQ